jgi:hypothetical protein
MAKLKAENKNAMNKAIEFIEKNPGCLLKDVKLEINKHKACLRNHYWMSTADNLKYVFSGNNYENILTEMYKTGLIKTVRTKSKVYHFAKDAIVPVEIKEKEIK